MLELDVCTQEQVKCGRNITFEDDHAPDINPLLPTKLEHCSKQRLKNRHGYQVRRSVPTDIFVRVKLDGNLRDRIRYIHRYISNDTGGHT